VAALSLTGTSGLWSDFSTADSNSTNQYGVFRIVGGVYNLRARVQLGSASSLVFSDSNFTVVFPQQSLVGDTFMGISIDLQHASTDIAWAGGVVASAGAKKGDLVVTGTAGTFDATGMTFSGLRIATLTSACSVVDSSFVSCGVITAAGATMTGCSVTTPTVGADTSALVWDTATDPNGLLDDMSFSKGSAAHHAIEFGTSSPTTMTLSGQSYSGFNASNGQNDSVLHIKRTTGTVTINISGGGQVPSYKSDGATVVIVSSVDYEVSGMVVGSELTIVQQSNGTVLFHVESTATGTETYSHGGTAIDIDVLVMHLDYVPYAVSDQLQNQNQSLLVQQQDDRFYSNP
jgi:hypothetical protein